MLETAKFREQKCDKIITSCS